MGTSLQREQLTGGKPKVQSCASYDQTQESRNITEHEASKSIMLWSAQQLLKLTAVTKFRPSFHYTLCKSNSHGHGFRELHTLFEFERLCFYFNRPGQKAYVMLFWVSVTSPHLIVIVVIVWESTGYSRVSPSAKSTDSLRIHWNIIMTKLHCTDGSARSVKNSSLQRSHIILHWRRYRVNQTTTLAKGQV